MQLRLCERCDLGRRFCTNCAREQRHDSIRRAAACYRPKLRARRLHAVRQARYRERRGKFSASKVTHHTATQGESASTSPVAPENVSGRKDRGDESNRDPARAAACAARRYHPGHCAGGDYDDDRGALRDHRGLHGFDDWGRS